LNKVFAKLSDFTLKNKYLILMFIIITIYFIIQYLFVFSWDFISYVLNAKYWFANGLYFEVFRPPLASFIIGLFGFIFGYPLAEIMFIIFTNILFLIACTFLANELKFDKHIFYLLFFTYFVLFYGLINGTELLSIAFLLFGIYYILKNKWISGMFIGLSALTRYTGIVFGVLLLFHKSIKNKIYALILFCLSFIPWFIYNKIEFGNFFQSIADQYFQNVVNRIGMEQAPKFLHFISPQSIFFIFTLGGLFFVIYRLIKYWNINSIFQKINLILLIILVYTIYSYFSIPFKHPRYLFTIMLPIAYFTYIGINEVYVWAKSKRKNNNISLSNSRLIPWVIFLSVIITCILIIFTIYTTNDNLKSRSEKGINVIYDQNLEECLMYSNNWIFYPYLDSNIVLLPIEIYSNKSEEYKNKVLFVEKKSISSEQFKELNELLPIIFQDESYVVFGSKDKCINIADYYVQFNNIFKQNIIVYTIDSRYTEPCNILFNKVNFIENTCKFINYDLFSKEK